MILFLQNTNYVYIGLDWIGFKFRRNKNKLNKLVCLKPLQKRVIWLIHINGMDKVYKWVIVFGAPRAVKDINTDHITKLQTSNVTFTPGL